MRLKSETEIKSFTFTHMKEERKKNIQSRSRFVLVNRLELDDVLV